SRPFRSGSAALEFGQAALPDQAYEKFQLRIAEFLHVRERPWYVVQIGRLAVPMAQPRENSGCLQVALRAHQLETLHEAVRVPPGMHARACAGFVKTERPAPDPLRGPADIAILEHRHEIVGVRAFDCV